MTRTLKVGALFAALTPPLTLGGCETVSMPSLPAMPSMPEALTPQSRNVEALELRLAEAEARNDALAREVAALRGSAAPGAPPMPAGVEAGRCYAWVGPEASASVAPEMLAPERESVRITPAIYEWVDEEIVVREARTEYVVTPAVVETVTENVLVEEGYTERTVMPALYEEVEAPGVVREAYIQWEPCSAVGESALCPVEKPARMGKEIRRQMVQPERVREVEIPARYMRVTREVVREPAKLETVEIPAETETVRVRRLVSPAQEERVTLPPVYAQAETDDAGASLGWLEVLCDTPANSSVVRAVQAALEDAGHDPGPADGVFGARTRAAMVAFQRARGLATGHLTRETVEALGVEFKP